MPELSVVVVSWNTCALLETCLDTLDRACGHLSCEIIVVDNGSTDGTPAMLQTRAVRVIANSENRGFAAANNQGLDGASAPHALLLNSDAFINRDCVDRALNLLERCPRAAMVGVTILNQDGSLQAAHGAFPSLRDDLANSLGFDRLAGSPAHTSSEAAPVDWVHGACMFVRLSAAHAVGGFDTRFFMYSEEVEWCHRFWESGWEVWYEPSATVVHLGGGSSSGDDIRRRAALYNSRIGLRRRMSGPAGSTLLWGGMLAGFVARIALRGSLSVVARRTVGRQPAGSDLRLLREIVRMDPRARWAVS